MQRERQETFFEKTPLHCAVFFGQKKAVKLLVEKGSNKEAEDKHQMTPLLIVVMRYEEEIIELLVDSGATLVPRSRWGSALHRVVKNSRRRSNFWWHGGH